MVEHLHIKTNCNLTAIKFKGLFDANEPLSMIGEQYRVVGFSCSDGFGEFKFEFTLINLEEVNNYASTNIQPNTR